MPVASVQAQNILTGKQTLLLRKSLPKGFVGWVYMYVTRGKPLLVNDYYREKVNEVDYEVVDRYRLVKSTDYLPILNGLIVARWWQDEVEEITLEEVCISWDDFSEYQLCTDTLKENEILKQSCLTIPDIEYYWDDSKLYAWKIKNLEIFNNPMELYELQPYSEQREQMGEVTKVRNWQYVSIKE